MAQDDGVHIRGRDSGPFKRTGNGEGAEFDCGEGCQLSIETALRSACTTYDDNILGGLLEAVHGRFRSLSSSNCTAHGAAGASFFKITATSHYFS
ncbi:hypothetical protein GCM10027404_01600 [Arthrobacter tumbae]